MCAQTVERPLPYYASSMIGRESEIELLEGLVRDPSVRLVTVTGSAGIGKTRLTTTVASTFQYADSDAVIFVPLVSVSDASLVAAEIGKALQLQGDDLIGAIRSRFSAHQGIVLLDNFEQVIDAAPDIAAMLPDNPDLTVIVTSQRPLQIQGERVVRLQTLPVPGLHARADELRQSPSVQLMLDRATAIDFSFLETNADESATEAIAEICRRLDGIPLALELAASRLASLSPEVVLAQLDRGRQILSTTRRDIPERQRTMHSAIAWSFDLLPLESQRIFLWLGAFRSGFDLELIDEITQHLGQATPSIDTVSELINLSLVRRITGGASPWYVMLDSIREFCLVELTQSGDRDAAQKLLADHVVEMANSTEEVLTSKDIGEWKAKLDREFSNIRAAVSWSLEHEDPEVPMLVAAGMWRYLEQEGRWQEAVNWVTQAQAWEDRLPEDLLIASLIAKMTMQEDGRDIDGALATRAKVEDLLRDKDYPEYQVQFLLRSGSIAQDQQKLDEALDFFEQAVRLAEEHRIMRNLAVGRANLGIINYLRGHLEEAEQNFIKCKESLEQLGDQTGVANILSNLAAAATLQDAPERALEYLDEAFDIIQTLGLKRDLIYTLLNKASALIALNDFDSAAEATEEAIELAQDLNYPSLMAVGFINLAEVYLCQGNFASSSAMLLRALGEVTPAEGSRHLVEIGILLSEALALTSRYTDAAAIFAKSRNFAQEIEFVFDPQHRKRIARVSNVINENLADPSTTEAKAEAWTTDRFVQNLTIFARRLSSSNNASTVAASSAAEASGTGQNPLACLTPREREILQLLIQGHSTQGMADEMCVSPRTVTTHLANMMSKLGVSSRAELVAMALRQ